MSPYINISGENMSILNLKKFHWTLSSMVLSTALITALISSIAGAIALYEMQLMKKNTAALTEEWLPKVSKTGEISTNIAQFRKSELEYADAKSKEQIKYGEDSMDESSGNVTIYSKAFGKLINDDKSQKAYDNFTTLWDKYSDNHDKFMSLMKDKKIDEANALMYGESQKTYKSLLDEMKNLSDIAFEGSLTAKNSSDYIAARAKWMVGSIALASLLLSIFIAWLITRYISKKIEVIVENLNSGSDVLNQSIVEIKSSSTNLSESVTEQVSALHETVSTVFQISTKVDQNNEISGKTLTASLQSINAADQGMTNMNDVIISISAISTGMEELLHKIDDSHHEIADIVEIISAISEKTKVINDIVFQTRLLSFNASVEAARAGEQGKGFAVVAEEVGKLAQMSGHSANEISTVLASAIKHVQEIVEKAKDQTNELVRINKGQISNGQMTAEKCSQTLMQIKSNSHLLNEMISKIAESSTEQANGLKEISNAISQLNDSTTYNSNIAQSTSNEAKNLDQQANKQSVLIEDLTKLIKKSS